jgi:hypothetical protein
MLATLAFLVVFLLLAPSTRAIIMASVSGAVHWLNEWSPISWVILGILMAAPVVSYLLMARWPKPEEPENPLKKYKQDDVLTD